MAKKKKKDNAIVSFFKSLTNRGKQQAQKQQTKKQGQSTKSRSSKSTGTSQHRGGTTAKSNQNSTRATNYTKATQTVKKTVTRATTSKPSSSKPKTSTARTSAVGAASKGSVTNAPKSGAVKPRTTTGRSGALGGSSSRSGAIGVGTSSRSGAIGALSKGAVQTGKKRASVVGSAHRSKTIDDYVKAFKESQKINANGTYKQEHELKYDYSTKKTKQTVTPARSGARSALSKGSMNPKSTVKESTWKTNAVGLNTPGADPWHASMPGALGVKFKAQQEADKQAKKDAKTYKTTHFLNDEEGKEVEKYLKKAYRKDLEENYEKRQKEQRAREYAEAVNSKKGTLKATDRSSEDYLKYQNASRMGNPELGKKALGKELSEEFGNLTAYSAAKNKISKVSSGVMQGLSYGDNIHGGLETYGKDAKNVIKDLKESGEYNAGYMGGQALGFLVGGVGQAGRGIVRGASESAAKKLLAENLAKRVGKSKADDLVRELVSASNGKEKIEAALKIYGGDIGKTTAKTTFGKAAKNTAADMAASLPMDVLDAAKMARDENGKIDQKTFASTLALNVAIGGAMGGGMEAASAAMMRGTAKKLTKLQAKAMAGNATQEELGELAQLYKNVTDAQKDVTATNSTIASEAVKTVDNRIVRAIDNVKGMENSADTREYFRLKGIQSTQRKLVPSETAKLKKLETEMNLKKIRYESALKTDVDNVEANIKKASNTDLRTLAISHRYYSASGMKEEAKRVRKLYEQASKNFDNTVDNITKASEKIGKALKSNVVVESGDEIVAALARTGRSVDDPSQLGGFIEKDADGNVVAIHINKESDHAMEFTLGHEITHGFENLDQYGEFKEALLKYVGDKEWNDELEWVKSQYQNVEDADFENEAVANLVGRHLFSEDSTFLDKMVKDNPSMWQKIYDFVKRIFSEGKVQDAQLDALNKKFDDMFNQLSVREQSIIKGSPDTSEMLFGSVKSAGKSKKLMNNYYKAVQMLEDAERKYPNDSELIAEERRKIFEKTMWFQGVDGKWRYEISDAGMKWTGKMTFGTFDPSDVRRTNIVYRDKNTGKIVIDEKMAKAYESERADIEKTLENGKIIKKGKSVSLTKSDKEQLLRRKSVLDSNLKRYDLFSKEGVPINEVLNHASFFKLFPQATDEINGLYVCFGKLEEGNPAELKPRKINGKVVYDKMLVLNMDYCNPDSPFYRKRVNAYEDPNLEMLQSIAHELQHYVQIEDGLSRGTSETTFRDPAKDIFSSDNIFPKVYDRDIDKLTKINDQKDNHLFNMQSLSADNADDFAIAYRQLKGEVLDGFDEDGFAQWGDYKPNPKIESLYKGERKEFAKEVYNLLRKDYGIKVPTKEYRDELVRYLYRDYDAGQIAERDPKKLYDQTLGEMEARQVEERMYDSELTGLPDTKRLKEEDRKGMFPMDDFEGENVRYNEFPISRTWTTRTRNNSKYYETVHIDNDLPDRFTAETGFVKDSGGKPKSDVAFNIGGDRNKIRLTEEDDSKYLEWRSENREKRKTVKAFKRGENVILHGDDETKKFIAKAIKDSSSQSTVAYGKVNGKLANSISAENPSVNVKDYYLELNPSDLHHSFERHSSPKEKGNIPLTEDNFKNIPDYIDNFDHLLRVRSFEDSGRTEVLLGKRINGYTVIVEIVGHRRGALHFKNMWGLETEVYEHRYADAIEKTEKALDEGASPVSAKADASSASPFSKTNIPQKGKSVKSQLSKGGDRKRQAASAYDEELLRGFSEESDEVIPEEYRSGLTEEDIPETYWGDNVQETREDFMPSKKGLAMDEQIGRDALSQSGHDWDAKQEANVMKSMDEQDALPEWEQKFNDDNLFALQGTRQLTTFKQQRTRLMKKGEWNEESANALYKRVTSKGEEPPKKAEPAPAEPKEPVPEVPKTEPKDDDFKPSKDQLKTDKEITRDASTERPKDYWEDKEGLDSTEATEEKFDQLLSKLKAKEDAEPKEKKVRKTAPTLKETIKRIKDGDLSYNEVSKHLETIYDAGHFEPKEMREQLLKDLKDGAYTKVKRETHANAYDRAEKAVEENWEEAYKRQIVRVTEEDLSAYDYAERKLVMQKIEDMVRSGDLSEEETIRLVKMHRDMSINEVLNVSNTGAALNASKIMKRMTPGGRAEIMIKKVEQMNKLYKDRLKGKQIELTDEQYQRILHAKDEEEAFRIMAEISEELMEDVPSTLFEKFNEVRRFMMLANLRTHERNLIGNTFFAGARYMSDAMEVAAYKIPWVRNRVAKLGGNVEKNKYVYWGDVQKNKDFLKEQFQKVYGASGSATQYRDAMRMPHPKAFKNRTVNKVLDFNYNALEKEDMIMFKPAFNRHYMEWCNSHGIKDVSQMTKTQLEQAGKYALEKAEYATFRDDSYFARKICGFKMATAGKKGNTVIGRAGYRAANMAIEGHLPFVKTPVNIMRRSMDYSPVGIARGIVKCGTADNPELFKESIHDFCTGMTGSGVALFGALLASQGWVTVQAGNVSGDAYYDRDMGYQDYSLVVHNPLNDHTYSVSIDWMSPMQTALFMGAGAYEKWQQDGFDFQDFTDVAVKTFNPMLDMSFLSTSKDTFEAFTDKVYRNGTGDNADWTGAITQTLFGKIPQGYLGSFVPQIVSQVATGSDKYQRDTRSTREDAVAASWESWARQIANKFPMLRQQVNKPKINRFGEDKLNTGGENIVTRWINALANPSNMKRITYNETDKELISIYNKIPDSDKEKKYFFYSFTGNPDYELATGGRMNYNELYKYGKSKRQTQTDLIQRMFDAGSYKDMSNQMKVDEINDYHFISQTEADFKVYKADYALQRIVGSEGVVGKTTKKGVADADRAGGKTDAEAWQIYKGTKGDSDKDKEGFVKFWLEKEKIIARCHDTGYETKAFACAYTGNKDLARAYDINTDKIDRAFAYVKNKGKDKAFKQFTNANCNIESGLQKAHCESRSKPNRSWSAAGYNNIDEATYRAMGFDWNSAQSGAGLRQKYKYDVNQLVQMKSQAKYEFDADSNGTLNKQETIDYIESLGIKDVQHKACLFEYLKANSQTKNPYDSINDYLHWGENIDEESGRGRGRGRGGWGRRGWGGRRGGGGSGGGGSVGSAAKTTSAAPAKTESGAIKGKTPNISSNFKPKTTNYTLKTRASNYNSGKVSEYGYSTKINEEYRKKARKLLEANRKKLS